jgi:hypothetical protein
MKRARLGHCLPMGQNSDPGRSRLGSAVFRVACWTSGAPLASFRFLTRQRPIEEFVLPEGSTPSALPPAEADADHREDEDGLGPVVHKLFRAEIESPRLSAERLIDVVAADPNVISPYEVVRFEKTRGEPGDLREGDGVLIRMAGPWNGPVEVTKRWEEGFRLAATSGHAQLGQVELRAHEDDGAMRLEIQTRERSATGLFHLLRKLGLVRRMQTHTWAHMLEAAAQLAGGRPPQKIVVETWHG